MKAIRLESFRALVDTGFVSLRPLTVLVGKNSSGKSSFLRFLPLLRQSVEARTTGPIQWYGDYVDFGGFDETLSSSSDDKAIRFGFRLTLDPHSLRRPFGSAYLYRPRKRKTDTLRPVSCELTLTIIPDPKDNSVTRFRSIALDAAGHSIHLDMEGPGRLGRILINGATPLADVHDELIARPGRLLPLIRRQGRVARAAAEADFRYRGPTYPRFLAYPELKEALRPLLHGNTSERKIAEAAQVIPFGTAKEILLHMRHHVDLGVRWQESVRQLSLSSLRFSHIKDLVVANWLGGLIQALDSELWTFAAGVRYIKPVRATAERYYRQQDLAVDEIDPEGRNLAVFLRSLTEAERRDFERWTSKELGWRIVTRLAGGHISLRIRKGSARSYNLTDVGFGFSQVLPVLAQLWSMQRNPRNRRRLGNQLTFAIEQPELHLHPALQARLADVLTRAIASAHRERVDLTVVVETHSEAIVNRIGHQIASGDIGAKQAAIVLFDAGVDASGTDVRMATFDDRGFLANWPFGFFEPD